MAPGTLRTMRRIPVLVAGLLALCLPGQGARADPPVAYVGPTYFTDVDKGGPNWGVKATGSQIPVDPSLYGVDPDALIDSIFSFSGADNAQGTITPGMPYWPRGWTSASRAVMGTSPAFMLAVQRRYVVDDFVVFVLDFAGDNKLTGDYYACGPGAFQPNPSTLGNNGAPGYYDGPFYTEGAITVQRGSTPTAPAAPVELYGYFGSIGGESPYCDQARETSALWGLAPPPPSPANDTRRTTRTEVTCNRGPNPGDPFACIATIGDSDQRAGASAPTGTAALTATSGSLGAAACTLSASPSSPATATCTFVYTNPSVGAGNEVPVTVRYHGTGTHKPSSGSPVQTVPDSVQPDTSGGGAVICGAPPLPSCESATPQQGPVQTCVGNVGGACQNINTPTPVQPAPIKVCIANVISACTGFTGGAVFAGELKPEEKPEVIFQCPDVDLFDTTPTYEACRALFTMTTEEAAIIKQHDAVFHEEIRLRYAIWQAVKQRGDAVSKHLERFTVADVSNPSLERSIARHNEKVRATNVLIDVLTAKQLEKLNVAHLRHIDPLVRLSTFPIYGLGPDGQWYYDPRVLSLSTYVDGVPKARAAAKKRRTFVKALGPSRKGQKPGRLTIARSRTVTVAPGKRVKVQAKYNELGLALLRFARARGQRTVAVRASVAMTSTGGRFAPTTVSRTLRAKLPKKAKKKPGKP